MAEESEVFTLTLAELESAAESAMKAAAPGRQKHANFANELAAGIKAFRRSVRSLAKRKAKR